MYPNRPPQQNLGFYIPPPMNFTGQGNQNMGFQQNSDMSDMLADIMRSKPNFGGDVFNGPVFQSKYRWFRIVKNDRINLLNKIIIICNFLIKLYSEANQK